MADMMTFPDTWEEFEKTYGFTDSDMVYTNGSRLIQSFRVKQWLDHTGSVAPSIDIVRCKECIDNSINCDGDENWCLRFGYDVEPSDFCSYGERREP